MSGFKRYLLMLFCCLVFVANANTFEQKAEQEIIKSNQYFKEKQYEKSADILLKLLDENNVNSNIYYNLGNAFYELKEYPKAILAYEKANKLDRNNKNIQHNLNLSYNKALAKIETSQQFFLFQWLNNFIYKYDLKTWSILFVIVLWIFAVISFLYFRTQKSNYIKWIFISFLMAFSLFFISLKNYNYQHNITNAIVIQTADIFSNPSELKKTKNTLEAGNKVTLIDKDGVFYKVKTSNDKIVWLQKSKVAEF